MRMVECDFEVELMQKVSQTGGSDIPIDDEIDPFGISSFIFIP